MNATPWVVDCDLSGARADLAVVDALARLQLTMQRLGGVVRLCGLTEELRDLIELAGLTDVFGETANPL